MKTVTKMPRYSAYKDSGVDWLGKIPNHWSIVPTKRKHKIIKQINKHGFCDNVLSLTLRGVVNNDILNPEGLVPSDYASYQFFQKNDLVFKLIDLENLNTSRVGLVHEDGIMSPAYIRLQVGNSFFPRYAYYYFYSLYLNGVYNNLGRGVRSTLCPSDLLNMPILEPSKDEQILIANHLDKKIIEIDQAILVNEKQVELLKERQQIIIQQAVTKGLDPNVPMKDSGIEWIGIIPAHWVITKLKFVSTINNGQDYKQVESDNGFPVIGSGGQFAFANSYLYDGEAVLLGRKGTIDKPLYINGKFWTVDTMFFAICKKTILTKYLYYCAKTIPFLYYSTATALPSMTQKDLLNHKIVLPLLSEQRKIINFVDQQIAITNDGIQCYQKQIEKLKEYKTTLIDSAVTGKIKITPEE